MWSHGLRDAVRVRLTKPRAEPAAEHDRFDIEVVDRGSDAGAERGDRATDERDREFVVLLEGAFPNAARQPSATFFVHDLEQLGLLTSRYEPPCVRFHRSSTGVCLEAPAAPARTACPIQ